MRNTLYMVEVKTNNAAEYDIIVGAKDAVYAYATYEEAKEKARGYIGLCNARIVKFERTETNISLFANIGDKEYIEKIIRELKREGRI